MRFFAVVSLMLVALFAAVSAIPAQQDVIPGYSLLVQEPEDDFPSETGPAIHDGNTERADRHRRATCDLLSFSTKFGSINHAACAAHCLAMRKGFRGGRCKDGVCHCRR